MAGVDSQKRAGKGVTEPEREVVDQLHRTDKGL